MLDKRIDLSKKTVLVTGAAGFIGANLVKRLINDCKGAHIVGIDNLNDYYDPRIKEYRLSEIEEAVKKSDCSWDFVIGSIADRELINSIFEEHKPEVVVNLAAQAGVRYSINARLRYGNARQTLRYRKFRKLRGCQKGV